MFWPALMKARALLRRLWIAFLFCSGLLRWAKWRLAARGGIVVLTFHRVLSDADFALTNSPLGMAVRERTFEQLAQHLAREYDTVDLGVGAPEWTRGGSQPRIAITFDDGWADNATTAFPIARRQGLPWTIFVCPERVGRPFPFWPERVVALWRIAECRGMTRQLLQMLSEEVEPGAPDAGRLGREKTLKSFIERLKTFSAEQRNAVMSRMAEYISPGLDTADTVDVTMTWQEIEGMACCGVTIGSHTLSHPILTRISRFEAQREITESKRVIERKLRRECGLFAYPNSEWSLRVREQVAQAGYEMAFAYGPGVWTRDSDPFVIPRINIWEGHLVGPAGRFSRKAFEYAVFWKAYRTKNTLPVRTRGVEAKQGAAAKENRTSPFNRFKSAERRG